MIIKQHLFSTHNGAHLNVQMSRFTHINKMIVVEELKETALISSVECGLVEAQQGLH